MNIHRYFQGSLADLFIKMDLFEFFIIIFNPINYTKLSISIPIILFE
jgi:hypothetical protein